MLTDSSTLATAVLLFLAAEVGLYVILQAPNLALQRTGKFVLLMGIVILPVASIWVGANHYYHEASQRTFCLSCHEMKPFGQSLLIDDPSAIPAAHFQNHMVPPKEACFTCHTNYGLFGTVRAKLTGMRHVWIHFFGKIPPPKDIKLYSPYPNANCLHCHKGMRLFESQPAHHTKDVPYEKIISGKQSCVASGCHDFIHQVGDLKDLPMWDPSKPYTPKDADQ